MGLTYRNELSLYCFSFWLIEMLTCEKVEIHITVCMWSHLRPKYPPLSRIWGNKIALLVLDWKIIVYWSDLLNYVDWLYVIWICGFYLDPSESWKPWWHHFIELPASPHLYKPRGSPGFSKYTCIQLSIKVSQSRIPDDRRQGCAFLVLQ